jgi:hypothetical protein
MNRAVPPPPINGGGPATDRPREKKKQFSGQSDRILRRPRQLVCAVIVRQGLRDACQHPLKILQYLVVPESDDLKSVSLETRGASRVLASFVIIGVLAAINFDDEPALQATEIDDVIADRVLAAKLCAFEAFRTKVLP